MIADLLPSELELNRVRPRRTDLSSDLRRSAILAAHVRTSVSSARVQHVICCNLRAAGEKLVTQELA